MRNGFGYENHNDWKLRNEFWIMIESGYPKNNLNVNIMKIEIKNDKNDIMIWEMKNKGVGYQRNRLPIKQSLCHYLKY